ncbi:class I SAM-dependent methyltransferase [Salinimicrobium sp. GXAS 041]|uniref:class I SAM-dependent methyltransferase n=1 Tax=Salinimicrobium sp. GXAS 041 TaxID=3400806 RepID=UPI003C75566F
MDRKEHWENIYKTKKLTDVSWYQPFPETSLTYIKGLELNKTAAIIDVGGGDSFLVDFLLAENYSNISVLDISEKSLKRAEQRLGERSAGVKWIHQDVLEYEPKEKFDLWHDRAAFHFFTLEEDVQNYIQVLKNATKSGSYCILGTFSKEGPNKCSGINVRQYSTSDLITLFSADFNVISCSNVTHKTPSGATQDFSFCNFQRK